MIKVIKNDNNRLEIQTSDGTTFFIKDNEKDLTISCEPSTVLCWKGKQFNNSLNLEDVALNLRSNQSISKFYELDYLLEQNDNEN